ncbi:ketoacyl-ACP synthase III family protein [Actinocrispum wychmicini]|uniref:3-oxoacyl-[acyl-carrier-protein] synthase-3 n=1 Tax=Actinocrispum wychmicini TaxID=1213861 RepID=A0A4R2JRS1_9PSEU|nr:ketoacyl-ACP synthase III family protein [Actinocrispum wychmicini]TCO59906.1 3-oxoacyl-[acyl-carrier-protein] synthase-3 [Actinocrispum wychmicini]
MKLRDVFIGGLGVCLPEVVPVQEAVDQGLLAAAVAERSGYTGAAVAGDTPPVEMALAATEQALRRAGQRRDDLAMLLYVDNYDNGPVGWYPQAFLQRLATGGDMVSAEVRQGCNGMFAALELAGGYLMAREPKAAAVIAAADNMTLPQINRWQCLRPDFIVGDAGSAVVLTKRAGVAALLSVASVTVAELEGMHRGNEPLFPPTTGQTWDFSQRIDDFNWRASTDDGVEHLWLPLVKARAELVDRVLDEAGIGIEEVTRLAYNHSSREHIEFGLLSTLDVPMSRSTWEFGRHVGHLGASDQIVALDHMLSHGELAPGDHVLMLGMSPGVNIAAAVVQILDPPN